MSIVAPRDNELALLLERARSGDPQAAWTLVATYTPHVQRVVRRHIPREVRHLCDSADFTQMVWASFFAGRGAAQAPNDLVAYLAQMARNQVHEWWRKHDRRRRLGAMHAEAAPPAGDEPIQSADRPSQVVSAQERWDRLVTRLPEKQQWIVNLKMKGLSDQEIADEVAVSRQHVSRVVDRLTTNYLHEP